MDEPERDAPAGRPDADAPWAIAERRSRAVEEPLDVAVLTLEPFTILEVRNPLHRTVYRVMLPDFPDRSVALCTCPDFARRGLGTCKHIEAGGRWLERHPDAPARSPAPAWDPAPIWAELDRRIGRPGDGKVPESLRWRVPGDALFGRPMPPYLTVRGSKEEVGRGAKRRPRSSPSRGRP